MNILKAMGQNFIPFIIFFLITSHVQKPAFWNFQGWQTYLSPFQNSDQINFETHSHTQVSQSKAKI